MGFNRTFQRVNLHDTGLARTVKWILLGILPLARSVPADQKTVAALSEKLSPHVGLGNSRRETLSLLTLAMLGARTTNLSVPASERTASASTASTYRRLQRFFQHANPGADRAAPGLAGLAGLKGPMTLILDRLSWKVGRKEINLLVLAVATRRHRGPSCGPCSTGRATAARPSGSR